MKVVDASVAAKWFLPEPGSDAALKLLSAPDRLLAPELIRLEVVAAIVRAFRNDRMTESVARDCCQAWDHLLNERMIQLINNNELHELAVKIALEIRHPFQDCLYLAAGKVMKAQVVTADDNLVKRGVKAVRHIQLLGTDDAN
ncbi:MAG: type II toxin-antitoxin system VapC family toxin [Tepidisphaeraceae bacterium]